MELNEKLQLLRKQKGLTQEQLAQALYVSRTAISKWESGRGYPNIDSLKAIARYFSVSVDDLLSETETPDAAMADESRRGSRFHGLIFGLLDVSTLLLLVLPVFGQQNGSGVAEVSLLALTGIAPYLRAVYLVLVACMAAWGILTLALQARQLPCWGKRSKLVSMLLNGAGAAVFIISRQPYGAAILCFCLLIKLVITAKRR